MAGRARLTGRPGWRALVLLALAVAALHAVSLDWLARELRYSTVLRPTVDPMFTRLLKPQAPPPVPVAATAPAPAAAQPARDRHAFAAAVKRRKPAASEPRPVPAPEPAQQVAQAEPEPEPQPPPAPAPEPPPAAEPSATPSEPASAAAVTTAAAPASAPASAASAPALDSWPADTRLSYALSGRFRSGDLYGSARVQWQREGGAYQVRVAVDVTVWASLRLTSQGEVTPSGLAPRAYEEVRNGKPRAVRLDQSTVLMEGGRVLPRPPGVQDTASQFVELAHRFATGAAPLQVGQSVSLWMARPGGLDLWTYDVVGREVLQTAKLGALDTFHLVPRPIANPRGNITAEMWFAPGLQYLPVRVRLNMGEVAFVDLLVDRVEQR